MSIDQPQPSDLCARCHHTRKVHCAGTVFHSTYKDQARQVPKPRGDYCVSRHCEEPLCSCVDFQE